VTNDLSDQIGIQSGSGGPISDEGDSGSCIVDSSGNIVGLLVGADTQMSYATPIQRVLQGLQIAICPSPYITTAILNKL
jgi:hypothetical protein